MSPATVLERLPVMVFFSLMIVMTELSMMLAFVSWLLVGYATLQDLSQRETDEQKVEAQRTSAWTIPTHFKATVARNQQGATEQLAKSFTC